MLAHLHNRTAFFKLHFVHKRLHEINAAAAAGVDLAWGRGVWDLVKVKSSTFVSDGYADLAELAAAANTDALSRVHMIAVNHSVIESLS